MNFKKLLFAALPALLLASCASDEPAVTPEGGDSNGKPMYAKIRVQVPTSSRSQTTPTPGENTNSDSGYEIGQDFENNIKNVTVVLATRDENGVYKPAATSADYNSISSMPDPLAENVYTILFKDEDIVNLHDQTVYIFAYCNANLDASAFSGVTDLAEMEYAINSAAKNQGIWKDGEFLMVNAPNKGIPTQTLPGETALRNNYNSPEKALNLGTVDVARAAARFDFKVTNDNKYDIFDVNDEVKETPIAKVELVEMAPLNIANSFYTLPRVSNDGTNNGWVLCGNEVFDNYVVSPNYTGKKSATLASMASNYFFASAAMPNYDTYDYDNINGWYGGALNDDDQNWTAANKEGYKIWRYVTENTIPGDKIQRTGISTGIVFKAKITEATGLMATAMENKAPIYYYSGVCYGDIANLRRVVANLDESAKMRQDFEKVFAGKNYLDYTMVQEGDKLVRKYTVTDNELTNCTSAQNNSTFKIYRPDETDGNYYVYYVYRNRHNDNNNPNVMAPMEFATVRNNVYKLAVTMISDFGHTNDPKDDPTPDNPENPDEDPKTYFKVSCRVLPWMVRVNNIEF